MSCRSSRAEVRRKREGRHDATLALRLARRSSARRCARGGGGPGAASAPRAPARCYAEEEGGAALALDVTRDQSQRSAGVG
eukprot:8464307-Pyramimonas_sp.AAC.1